ncbi:hypothetical protein Ancab_032623 [Ancistrocladus abbreviatus]
MKQQHDDGALEETSIVAMLDYASQNLADAKEENKDDMGVEELVKTHEYICRKLSAYFFSDEEHGLSIMLDMGPSMRSLWKASKDKIAMEEILVVGQNSAVLHTAVLGMTVRSMGNGHNVQQQLIDIENDLNAFGTPCRD